MVINTTADVGTGLSPVLFTQTASVLLMFVQQLLIDHFCCEH